MIILSKVRNILFSLIVLCVFALPIINVSASVLVDGYNRPVSSTLEARKYAEFPIFEFDKINDGEFQDNVEEFVADAMPKRDGLLLYNAYFQRCIIYVSNSLFGFKAYPTYFGSKYYCLDDWNAIVARPQSIYGLGKRLDRQLDAFKTLIESNDGTNFVFYLVDHSSAASANPIHDLASNTARYDDYTSFFSSGLPNSCQLITDDSADLDEYYERFFKTDHHMQIQGAIRAYERIAYSLHFTPVEAGDVYLATDEQFFGSFSRRGLVFDLYDSICDVHFDMNPSVEVFVDGSKTSLSSLSKQYSNEPFSKKKKFENMYASWFHASCGMLRLSNEDAECDDTLLIIGDSYMKNMERFFTKHYRTVIAIDPRYFNGDLQEVFDSYQVNDCVFILSPATITDFDSDVIDRIASHH